jgi:hypothetical protein
MSNIPGDNGSSLNKLITLKIIALTAFMLWLSYNGHFWGYIFSGAYFPQKLTPKTSAVYILSHDTSSFKDTRLLIYSKEVLDALYGPHLYCYKPLPPTYLMKRTVRKFAVSVGNRIRLV